MITKSSLPLLLFLSLVAPGLVGQQDPKSGDRAVEKKQGETIITATRLDEPAFAVPFATETITSDELRRRSYRTTPQALRDVPGIMVQETAHGHGSPYIRGFTSFRNLFLIDGVRLNNSVFRPGPNQYWNTVDPFSLESLEVVKGPSSVLYGSDAIGGTVNARTKSAYTYDDDSSSSYGGTVYVRYATAEDSVQGRGELSFGQAWDNGTRTGILLGGSAKAFGDLEGGSSVGQQNFTGYDETDFDIKVDHWLDETTRLVFLHQGVRQDDVPRTHRTVHAIRWRGLSRGSDQQRKFDQNRRLTYLQFHKEEMGGTFESIRANLSWHEQDEVRDRIRGNGNQEFQGFDVGTLGVSVQLESETSIGRLNYGIEHYHDRVDSFRRRVQNPSASDAIQGPVADDATYDLLGVYAQGQIDVADDLEITVGARFTYAAVDADSVRDPVSSNRITVDEDWTAFTGSLRFRYRLVPDEINVFGGVSQGFRAPNLSDLTRFGNSRTNEFEIPATNLDPEDYLTYEIGVKAETDDVSMQAAYFYTDIEDQILRFLTGNTNASGENEVTKANVGDGHIQGFEFGAAYRLMPETTVFGNATYMHGRVTNFDGTATTPQETYLTRMMPLTVQAGVRWEDAESRLWAETRVVRAEDADKLSFGDLRDTSRIPPGGTPSYTLWHAQVGVQVAESTTLDVLLENITDVDYRVHGSGLNRPGRNLVLAFLTRF